MNSVTETSHVVAGVDHVAYVTWKPEETIRFYRDILGFPVAHCILARGWGNDGYPDFAHFFFDIGRGARIAFFYYFGETAPEPDDAPALLQRARHLAIRVDTSEELEMYRRRLETNGYPMRHRGQPVSHELIESIYFYDPNGYNIEIARDLRAVEDADVRDSELSIEALIDVCRSQDPTLDQVWERKADLLSENGSAVET